VRLMLDVEAPFDGRTVSFTETFSARGWERPRVSRSTLRFLEARRLEGFLTGAGFVI
jgi:hypothetical protein